MAQLADRVADLPVDPASPVDPVSPVDLGSPVDLSSPIAGRRAVLAALLLTGLAAGTYAQGGFHARGQAVMAVALTAAVILALATIPLSHRLFLTRPSAPVAGLTGWLLLDAALHGSVRDALPAVSLVAGIVVTIGCARLLADDSARLFRTGLLWLGTVVALLGWAGVLRHRTPAAIEGQGLYRAASTLSYPNATGVFLAIAVLVSLALLAGRPATGRLRIEGALAAVLLTGLAATLSRGAVLALAAGMLVLGACLGAREILAVLGYPLLGGCIGAAALLPSAPVDAPPNYPLAVCGLAVAVLLGAFVPSRSLAIRWQFRYAGLHLAPYVLLLPATLAIGTVRPVPSIGHARLNVASDDRWSALHATWQVIARQPFTGVGPRLTSLAWHPAGGGVQIFRYAHNEYLQVVAEFGLIGLALMLSCLAVLVRLLIRNWPYRTADRALPATAAAALAALLVSISLDFTGHFPVLVLTAAALVGCAVPVRPAQ